MYKVFINQKAVIFTSLTQFDNQLINKKNVLVVSSGQLSQKSLELLLKNKQNNLFVVCKDLSRTWRNFVNKFKLIKAGGGLVLNKKGDLLFILRKGKWDLPKGKLDKGEKIDACAKREVMEECGIKKIKLHYKLCDTFHVYDLKGKPVLKKTTWYLMGMEKAQKLTPQVEEDIHDLRFFSRKNYLNTVKRKTYPLISDLIDHLPQDIF